MLFDWLSMTPEQRWWNAGILLILLIIAIIGVQVEHRKQSSGRSYRTRQLKKSENGSKFKGSKKDTE